MKDVSSTKASMGSGESEITLPNIQHALICSTFNQFSFTTWTLDSDNEDDEYNRSVINQSYFLLVTYLPTRIRI